MDNYKILRPRPLFQKLIQDADACEWSCSLSADGVEERVLLFFDKRRGVAEMLAHMAQMLAVPSSLITQWSKALPRADAVGIALRVDGGSVRLYTQYWDLLCARLAEGMQEPIPLYLGFKALDQGVTRTDSYICLPAAPRSEFWPEMSAMFAGLELDKTACEKAFEPLDAESCIFTRTASDRRKSWLSTVRRAELDRTKVADALSALKGGEADRLASVARRSDLVHIAGGQDDVKGQFGTFYFQISAREAEDRLSNAIPEHGN